MYAVRAARAFDGERFLPDGATVLVEGERIRAVETFGHVLPSGVDVGEHEGTLLPGLVDRHTHLVADCTIGGLERAGEMAAEAVDEVVLASLGTHLFGGVTLLTDVFDGI